MFFKVVGGKKDDDELYECYWIIENRADKEDVFNGLFEISKIVIENAKRNRKNRITYVGNKVSHDNWNGESYKIEYCVDAMLDTTAIKQLDKINFKGLRFVRPLLL